MKLQKTLEVKLMEQKFIIKDSNGYDTFFTIVKNEESEYTNLIEKSFESAKDNKSKLSDWVLGINGMSGVKYRHFINNLIENLKNPKYLEIGCWRGSTSCSALYGNLVDAYCIDNWVEFGGPKQEFMNNMQRCVDESEDKVGIEFEENDFRQVNYDKIGNYNVYMFDGPHEEDDQYDGVVIPQNALDNEFIFICDDWNWKKVRNGTEKSFLDLNLKVLYSLDIRTTSDDSHPVTENSMQNSDWHNGYYIAVCKKCTK
jgi:hypothetical protein